MFLTAIGSSGSLSTERKLSSPTQVARRHEVRVLQRHDHRADDRVPRERPEDEQHRQQEEQCREASRPAPTSPEYAVPAGVRACSRLQARCPSSSASMGSTVAMRKPPRAGDRSYGRPGSVPGPGRPYEVELLALADQGLCGAFAASSNCWMFAFLSVRTASTAASSEWYTLCVEAAGSGTSC